MEVFILSLAAWTVSIAFALNSGKDYCHIYGEAHTFCKYQGIPKDCQGLVRGVENFEKVSILSFHNKVRSKVASGNERKSFNGKLYSAADMTELDWDDELANIAQRWADQCIPNEHDLIRASGEFQFVGQNVATTWTADKNAKPNWENAIKLWYAEVKNFDSEIISNFQPPSSFAVYGHFTQLIWANTRFVGCGYSSFRSSMFKNLPYAHLYVCNYGPAGNFLNHSVYKFGKPCSQCPRGFTCSNEFEGLCKMNRNAIAAVPSKLSTFDSSLTSTELTTTNSPILSRLKFPKVPFKLSKPKALVHNPFNFSSPFRRPNIIDLSSRSLSSFRTASDNKEDFGSVTLPCSLLGIDKLCNFIYQGEKWHSEGNFVSSSVPTRKTTELILESPLEPDSNSLTGRYCLRIEFIRYVRITKEITRFNMTSENLVIRLNPSQGKQIEIPIAVLSTNEKEWLEAKVTISGFKSRSNLSLKQSGPNLLRGKIPILRSNILINISIGNILLENGAC